MTLAPGAFKLNHLQPVKPIVFPKFCNFFILILGSPILITPERKADNGKMEFSQSKSETQGFKWLGHSNWTICSVLSQFCSLNFATSTSLLGSPILITQERGRLKMGKLNSPNLSETQGLEWLGQSNWTICSLLSQFCSLNFETFTSLY